GTEALSTRTSPVRFGDDRTERALWLADVGFRRPLSPRTTVEAHYVYQHRIEDWHPPTAIASFRALDRIGEAEVGWQAHPDWRFRAGLLYDRVGIANDGRLPGFTWFSRKESRGFLSVQARLGRVRFQGTECIELDHEAYNVTFHHDKGF